MIKIKKKRKDYDQILWIGDTHFGHNKPFLWEPRGFKSSEEHDEWLQDQIDSVSPDSLIIHCGDTGLSVGSERIKDFMLTFPCETLMIKGNHNSGVQQLYQEHLPEGFQNCELYPIRITPNITLMGYEFLLDIDHHKFYVRHMAPLIWPEQNRNRVSIIAHSHSNLKQANPDGNGFGKMLDVGVENAKRYNGTAFFKLEEVVDIMSRKETSHFDHH
jgi:calcineurin-like phosphoesterase family protein